MIGLHVVERRHLLGPDDRDAPLLVRVKPGEVQVGDPSGGEAQVAEHDVLDPVLHIRLAVRRALLGLFADQVQHDRHVVRAEAPQRVLLGPQLAEVHAVAVDVIERPQRARVDQLLQARHRRVVLEQVADHQDPSGPLGGGNRLLGVGGGGGERLLDEAVLSRLGDADRQFGVGRYRGQPVASLD